MHRCMCFLIKDGEGAVDKTSLNELSQGTRREERFANVKDSALICITLSLFQESQNQHDIIGRTLDEPTASSIRDR